MALSPTKSRSRSRGVLLVEAAIVLPLLLMLSFLLLQYGWLFLKAEEVSNAARHGARRAVVAGATPAQVTDAVQSLMTKARLSGRYTLEIEPRELESLEKGQIVTVTVSVDVIGNPQVDLLGFSETGGLIPVSVLPPKLISKVSMAKERS